MCWTLSRNCCSFSAISSGCLVSSTILFCSASTQKSRGLGSGNAQKSSTGALLPSDGKGV
ncbi:hypothetical protein PR002_g9341 [Phytophthora rubi]|uniref:RxLR effector protein n=1 Tax=Phytophthora rubi TaxID=129364 RepID=A0A6A3MMB5_9STRA|nr:hypothetical protein PR002_g9341 [Phytophthora rubi]